METKSYGGVRAVGTSLHWILTVLSIDILSLTQKQDSLLVLVGGGEGELGARHCTKIHEPTTQLGVCSLETENYDGLRAVRVSLHGILTVLSVT